MGMTVLAAVTLALVLGMFATLVRGALAMRDLTREPLPPAAGLPSVSVVVAARDEARGIEAGVRSILAQDHPAMEVTVVDDRSSDATPAILARIAAQEPRLRVVRVDELPAGWLGKNHALHLGAASAGGELLLFTDADVVLDPTALRRAAGHLQAERLDHLALGPRVIMPGWLLEVFGVVFGILFALYVRPWRVADPDDPAHVGIGAFNLIRTEAYRRLGGHELIRMRPDDDLKLGKLVKLRGLRQGFAAGSGLVSVEWYHSLREAFRGLRKNSFAGVEYRASMVLGSTLFALTVLVWPFLAPFLTSGPARWIYLATAFLLLATYAGAARHQGLPAWRGIAFPIAALMFVGVLWNSMLYVMRHRGIEWRGTHYPIEDLKANRI
jgi:glycosyltransferase involved in cell wall biosynthesis